MNLLTYSTLLLAGWLIVSVNSQYYYLPWPYYHQTPPSSSGSSAPKTSPADASLQDLYSELFQQTSTRAPAVPSTFTALALESCASRVKIPADVLRVLRNPNLVRYGTSTSRLGAHAQTVHNLLLESRTAKDAICTAHALRDQTGISRLAWLRGVMSTTMSRPDMVSLVQPTVDKYDQGGPWNICRMLNSSSSRFGYGPENRLWYWLEDLALNLNHWNWHRIHELKGGDLARWDRRGELFYYFHHGILARYHSERLATGLLPVEPMFLSPGQDAWPYHAISMDQASNWTEMIRSGFFIYRNDRAIRLNSNGFDMLVQAIAMEASKHSATGNRIGSGANPSTSSMEEATVMRDPLFYAYYALIDTLFDQHKSMLEPYMPNGGDWPLHWPQVEVTNVRVETQDQPLLGVNKLITFWRYPSMDSDGDSGKGSKLNASCTRQRLDHKPFTYHIEINRRTDGTAAAGAFINGWGWAQSLQATIRIFMTPRLDTEGKRYSMAEQRKLFFPMDQFSVQLRPGQNVIERRSEDSALTAGLGTGSVVSELNQQSTCGDCGWPHHLLLPKGTLKGQAFDLFVMVTNGKKDAVSVAVPASSASTSCHPTSIYCGAQGEGDARPMNYPFDRLPYSVTDRVSNTFNNVQFQFWPSFQDNNQTRDGAASVVSGFRMVKNLDEYTAGISNMGTAQVTITHVDNSILHPPLLPWHFTGQFG